MRGESPTPQTAAIPSNHARAAMFVDGRTISAGEVLEADVAIVGGGAAGITLAMELDARRDAGPADRERGLRVRDRDTARSIGARTSACPTSISSRRGFDTSAAQPTIGRGPAGPSRRSTLQRTHGSRRAAGRSASRISIRTMRAPASSAVCRSDEWSTDAWIERSPYPPLPLDPAAVETRVAQNVPDTRRRFARNYR